MTKLIPKYKYMTRNQSDFGLKLFGQVNLKSNIVYLGSTYFHPYLKERLNMFLVPTKIQAFKFSFYKSFIHFWSLFAFYRNYFGRVNKYAGG